ncbi:MAG: phytanoyl-CoA dioxygenase family protein [Planctomycetes bacterium]|nr:phytanoyl-CoA dioxygenase family protein [Planctomycetota bacterium]
MSAPLSQNQLETYRRDGYVTLRQLFDHEEIDLLREAAKQDHEIAQHASERNDGEGGSIRLSLWNHPGEGIYGMFARCHRVVDAAEQILGGEVYHYHSKMIMKEPKVGGAWAWHQDYGYWYQNGILFPLLTSVMIAVDPATRENGCLKVIRGSHQMGRVDHVLKGDQAGADDARVEQALARLELEECKMEPGDAIFFDCNLLHRSDRNHSENPRWSMICCYNAARNNPFKESHHPRYTPLSKVKDSAIKEVGLKRFEDDDSDVSWLSTLKDSSASSLKKDAQ